MKLIACVFETMAGFGNELESDLLMGRAPIEA